MEELKEGWRKVKLGNLCSVKGGKRLPKGENLQIIPNKHPYIRIKDLVETKNLKLTSNFEFVPEKIQEKIGRYIVSENDIIISIVGTIGLINKIDKTLHNGNLTENCVKLINLLNISPDFLYYYLKSEYGQFEIKKGIVGAVQQKLPIKNIQNIEINLPPLETQEKIDSILSALDDKIEINNEMNKTLEEMAQTLFKRWFIDFDFPNENGEPYRSSGGKMVDSELGEIPEGWEIFQLESLVEKLSKGTTPTKKDVENATSIEKVPFIKVKDLKDDGEIIINNLEYISRDISENKLKRSIIKTNDLLFTIAGTIGKVSIIPPTLSNGNLNQAIAFIRLKNLKYREYIYYYLKSKETQSIISSKIVQAVQANVSLSILNNLKVLNPTHEILDSYNLLVRKIFDLYLKNQQEKQSLTEIRDTLLPKLMSGEVEV